MNSYLIKTLTLCFCLLSINVYAQNTDHQTIIKNWEIHHIAFPSTFIQANVAKAVGVERRNNNGLINISILNTDKKPKQPLKLTLTGYAKNLVGQRKELSFKEVDEGNAIYYLAEVRHANEETFRFYVTLTDPKTGRVEEVKFMQKMWVD